MLEFRFARWFMRPWKALFVADICPCELAVVLALFEEDETPCSGFTSFRLNERMPDVPCEGRPASR